MTKRFLGISTEDTYVRYFALRCAVKGKKPARVFFDSGETVNSFIFFVFLFFNI